jgi:hypothetical protein
MAAFEEFDVSELSGVSDVRAELEDFAEIADVIADARVEMRNAFMDVGQGARSWAAMARAVSEQNAAFAQAYTGAAARSMQQAGVRASAEAYAAYGRSLMGGGGAGPGGAAAGGAGGGVGGPRIPTGLPPDDRAAREAEAQRKSARRETWYQQMYLYTLQRQIDVVGRLGQELIGTAREWVHYAGSAEKAEDVMLRAARAHGVSAEALADYEQVMVEAGRTTAQARSELAEYMQVGLDLATIVPMVAAAMGAGGDSLNAVMIEQWHLSARLKEEFGAGLLPAYKAGLGIVNDVKRAFVEASDGMQEAVAIGTVATGTFLSVGASVLGGAVGLAKLVTVARSVLPVLGLTGGAALTLAGGIGAVAAATAAAVIGEANYLERNKQLEAQVIATAETYEEYLKGIEPLDEQFAIMEAAMSGTGMALQAQNYTVAKSREEWEAAAGAARDYAAVVEMSGDAILQMAMTSRAMVPAAAEIFGAGARGQRDIENEIETLRRRRAYVAEELERGYTPELFAEQERIDVQIRRAELAAMEQEKATMRAIGGMAIDYIGAWAQATGEFGAGWEAMGAAGVAFGKWEPAQWEQARDVFAELEKAGIGMVPWAEAIAGAAEVTAEAVNITANTVALDGPVVIEAIYLPESLFPGVGGAPGQEPTYTVQPSLGEEALTEGIRTRR